MEIFIRRGAAIEKGYFFVLFKNYEHEGIFIFGGKDASGKPVNTLKVLKIGSNPLKLQDINTVGAPPRARFGHCCHFLKTVHLLVVFGGRNDDIYKITGKIFLKFFSGSAALDDIVVLNLKYYSWCNVRVRNINPGPCYNFGSFSLGNFFIFLTLQTQTSLSLEELMEKIMSLESVIF